MKRKIMVGKAFTRHFDSIMTQPKTCFFIRNFGLLYPKALYSRTAGDSHRVGAGFVPTVVLGTLLNEHLCFLHFAGLKWEITQPLWLALDSYRLEAYLISPFIFLECCSLWKLKCFESPPMLMSRVPC